MSSDQEDDPAASSAAAKPSNKELFGDSSSEDDDDVHMNEETKQASPTDDKPRHRSIHEEDDDSDEDDVEFDDKGAVVGVSETMAGDKLPSISTNKLENQDDGDKAETATGSTTRADTAKELKEDSRTLVTPETTRPGDGVKLQFTRLPNLIGIQPEAFDVDTYNAAIEEEDYTVHDMIRWRYQRDANGQLVRDDNDQLIRESNARLVQWEDGSWTLHIGKEAYEVDATDSSSGAFAGLNGYLYKSQAAAYDNNEPAGTVLECMGPIQSRLIARPSSLQSDAHKSMTVAVRQKTIKKARIAEFVTSEDPEAAKLERIKVKQELEKAAARKKSGGGYYPRATRPRMSREYLEDEEDFDTTNIKALKRGADYEEMDDYGDDESESSEGETFHTIKPKQGRAKKAAAAAAEESDDDIVMEEDDDEEEVVAPVKRPTTKKAVQAVMDDESD